MAKVKVFFWKIWLRLNFLTPDVENDYIGEVSTVGHTITNEEIAESIVKDRTEWRYETILSILNERDEKVIVAVQSGSSVQDGAVHITPRPTGTWIGSDHKVDPEKHKPSVTITPTARLREALGDVKLEVLGVKDSGAYIGLVTDVATKATDGHITANSIIIISGDKLRIFPEDEDGLGVFFVDGTGVKTPASQIAQNDPKKLMALVPPLAPDTYTLEIVTRFSNGTTPLKAPRTITYDLPLIVL